MFVPFDCVYWEPNILSHLKAFSMASQKLSSGPHSLSLGFLESLPTHLATSISTLAFEAYLISLNCHYKRLQGCLDLSVLGIAY